MANYNSFEEAVIQARKAALNTWARQSREAGSEAATIFNPQTNSYAELASLGDEDNIVPHLRRGANVALEQSRAAVFAADIHELEMIVSALKARVYPNSPSARLLGKGLEHEAQHMEASQQLGITAFRFGVYLEQTDRGTDTHLFIQSSPDEDLIIPKLGWAAKIAYPAPPRDSRLSPDHDLRNLRALGYDGFADVTNRVIAQNWMGTNLPVPLNAGMI